MKNFFVFLFVFICFSFPVSALTEYDPVTETLEIDGKYIKLDDFDNILIEYYNHYGIISDAKAVAENPFNICSSLKLAFDSNSALLDMIKDGLKIGRDEFNNSSVKFFPNGIKVANELLNYDTIERGVYYQNNSYFFVCNNSDEYKNEITKLTFPKYFKCSVSAIDQSGKKFKRTFTPYGNGPYYLQVTRTSNKKQTIINVNSLTDSIGTSNNVSSWLKIKFEGDLPVSNDVINYDNCLDSSSVSPSDYPVFSVPIYSDSSCTNLVDSSELPYFTSFDVPGSVDVPGGEDGSGSEDVPGDEDGSGGEDGSDDEDGSGSEDGSGGDDMSSWGILDFLKHIFIDGGNLLLKIVDSILGLTASIVSALGDLLKSLFVPSENYFSDNFNSLKDKLIDRIGYQQYIDIFGSFDSRASGYVLQDITVNWFGKEVVICKLTYFEKFRELFNSFVYGFTFFGLAIFNYNQIYRIFRNNNYAKMAQTIERAGGKQI